jgi:hypothetical protein
MPGDPGRNLDGSAVNRFLDLISEIPKGQFYSSTGIRVPYQGTRPFDIVIETVNPTRAYGLFLNGKFQGTITTDSSGFARFQLVLDHGTNTIILEDDITAERIQTVLDALTMHTAHAALAEVIEGIDESITDSFNDRLLEFATRGQIEDVWGKKLLHLNTPAYQHEAYREQLQEVHQAYRMFGGRHQGLDNTVAAITTVTPLVFPFRTFGPRWALGNSFLRNADFQARNRTQFTRTSAIPGITIDSVAFANQLGAGTLAFIFASQKLSWTTPGGVAGPSVTIVSSGSYALAAPGLKARFDGRINGTFAIVAATNDRLRLNVDGIGSLDITLTAGGARTGAQVAADINAAFVADVRYGAGYGATASVITTTRIRLTGLLDSAVGSILLENIAADAYFTVFGYPWVRSTLVNPEVIGSVSLELVISDDFQSADASNTFQVLIARNTVREEIVTIFSNNRIADTLGVPAPGLITAKLAGDIVEPFGSFPYQTNGSENTEQGIVVTVNTALTPLVDDTETVTLLGSNVSDFWLATNATADMAEYSYFEFQGLRLAATGAGDVTLEAEADERVFQYREWLFDLSMWVRNTSASPYDFYLGVNFGSGWVESGAFLIPSINTNNADDPTFITFTVSLPFAATRFGVRIRQDFSVAPDSFEVSRAVLRQPNVTALNLGINTTPRSEHRAYFGELIYIWSPQALTAPENGLLGLPFSQTTPKGHVDTVLPAHVEGDRFDISTYALGVPQDIRGVFDEVELFAGTMTNMQLVVRTPPRRSFVFPSRISQVSDVTLAFPFPPVAPFIATLAVPSNQDQTESLLFENEILVPNNRWQYDSATQIRVLTGYNSGATYVFNYQALIRYESPSIDLLASFSDFVWFVDMHAWTRFEPELLSVRSTTQVVFNPQTRRGRLADRSDQDKTQTTLTENNGLSVRTVPSVSFRYLDNQTILIDATEFKQTAIYFLTFQALRANQVRVPQIVLERRRAGSLIALAAAPYVMTSVNETLPASGRFLQYRMTATGIVDQRDLRLSSVSAKGLLLIGAGSIPVLRP